MEHVSKTLRELSLAHPNTEPAPAASPVWQPRLDAYEPSLVLALAAATRFVADMAMAHEPRWLTFAGVCGCGKTFLALQIFAQAEHHNPGNPKRNPIWPSDWATSPRTSLDGFRRPRCVWMTANQFAARMRGGDYQLPEYLAEDFLVAIDDIGAARDTTNFIADALYRLCNVRLGRWTLFTTNLTLGDIEAQIDGRVASRLIRDANSMVDIDAGDYALRPHRAKQHPATSQSSTSTSAPESP